MLKPNPTKDLLNKKGKRSKMFEPIFFQSLWNFKNAQLKKEIKKFRIKWDRIKRCKCKNLECKHYKKEEWERFGGRINCLFNQSLLLKKISFSETISKSG